MTIITERELYSIPLSSITDDGTDNIRTEYDDSTLKELAASIKSEGLLSPLIVRQGEDDTFLLVAGHRRYRALQLLVKSGDVAEDQLITCFVSEGDVGAATVTMLVENLQREDILIMDEARGYMRLVGEHGFKVKELAAAVGRSQAHINARLSLLTLDPELQGCIGSKVTIETALDIAKITDEKARKDLSKKAIKGQLGTWQVGNQLRDEEKAKVRAQIMQWAEKNMLTIHETSQASPAKDRDVWTQDRIIPQAELKSYVPKKGDILVITFYGDAVAVYRKFTKAELTERAERAAAGLAERDTRSERETNPFTEWEDRADAHEDAVEVFHQASAEAALKFIDELPTKTIGKIVLEQAAWSLLNGRAFRMDAYYTCQAHDIEVIDQSPLQALADHVGTSTEKALRFYVHNAFVTYKASSTTLTEGLAVEFERLGLVDPGVFTDPEPWQDDDGVWHLEEYVPPADDVELTPEELQDLAAEAGASVADDEAAA